MEVIFLGTGTSQGVPMIACDCAVCRSEDPRDRRSRTSVHVVMDGLHVQVDAAPEFRLQCLANDVRQIDHFILTHGHADHLAGMDDLRRFCDARRGEALPVYSTPSGLDRVRAMFPYALAERASVSGYPAFSLREMPTVLEFPQGTLTSTLLPHGSIEVLGLVFEERSTRARFTYYTDCKRVPPDAIDRARGSHVVVLDGLRPEPHPTHMSLSEAVEVAAAIGAPRTYLTHLTHAVSQAELGSTLPREVSLSYDGLRLLLP